MKGFCSDCRIDLNSENCTPTVLHSGYGYCNVCARNHRKWYKSLSIEEKLKVLDKHRWNRRQRKYGVTREEFNKKFEEQKGLCSICLQFMNKPRQDHDHVTKKIRDLLCANCNILIGMAHEQKSILLGAIQYLEKWTDDNSKNVVCSG